MTAATQPERLPQLRVVCGADASLRMEHAQSWLAGRGRATQVALVGATMQAAADLARHVGREVGASFGWQRLTLARLAWSLAGRRLAERGRVPVGTLASEAVCARVVHDSGHAGLGRFQPIADRPGLPRALARTFAELRLERRRPADIADADLARLFAAYEAALGSAGLADRAELLEAATEVARAGGGGTPAPLLFLDVPVHSARELELVAAIVAPSPAALFTLVEGDERTRRNIDSICSGVERADRPARTALDRLKLGLFAEKLADQPTESRGVRVFSAPGESRECVEIARLIHQEAERGVPFDRMAILLRSPLQYRAHVHEALRRASIPAHFARGTARPDPGGRAFLALLVCAAQGLSAARFAEFLSLGEVPDPTPGGAPPPAQPRAERWVPSDDELQPRAAPSEPGPRREDDAADAVAPQGTVVGGTLRAPRHWERLIVEASVIGGISRWRRRLDGLREELSVALAEMDDPDDARAEGVRRDQRALGGLKEYALPLLEDLASLPASAPWGVWLDRLGALATRALRHPARVLAVLAELAPMAAVGPVDLTEVRIVLEDRLTEVIVPPSERRLGHVFVGAAEDARGLAFDVVFIPGLAEKLFPQKVVEDPILPDRVRTEMGLPTNAERAAKERLALRLAVGAARERATVSYPRLDLEQSRPRTPSFYGLEVLRAAEGALPGFDELARRSNITGAARVGWPAPPSPADAIDHAEHDLALLEGVLKRSEAESVGMARYLLGSNPHLERALRARARRWLGKWNAADGLVFPAPDALDVLRKNHGLGARSYSPTGLQNYAACPYRFLLQAVHKLAPREEPVPLEELDPLQKGSLVHEAQFELHKELRQLGLLPVTPENLEQARSHLDRVLKSVADRFREKLAPAIERVWEDGVAGIAADMREWLRRSSLDPYTPRFFELSFGLRPGVLDRAERDARSTEEAMPLACGIKLRGSIDLVEESPDGGLRATDYKTGKVRAHAGAVINGGNILQPVLYALALEKLLPDRRVEGGRLYYCTTVGEFTPVDVALDESARRAADLVAKTVGAALEEAFLPAAPAEGACEYCDYRAVCGPYEEERVKRKRPQELTPLAALRKHP